MAIDILTHRGLDPSRTDYFPESSMEAFADQLGRGYGIEFDVAFREDGAMVASHAGEGPGIVRAPLISDVLDAIGDAAHRNISALHVKSRWQDGGHLETLAGLLRKANLSNIIVFDLKIEPAKYLKTLLPTAVLAASVAHPYDIERYTAAVGGTLMSLDDVIRHRDVFDWAWLDEWDRIGRGAGENGNEKSLYTAETFAVLREHGFKIALVTPELHATSPGLLGGEAHRDAATHERLMTRIGELLLLKPDAVCTDYPDEVRDLARKIIRI